MVAGLVGADMKESSVALSKSAANELSQARGGDVVDARSFAGYVGDRLDFSRLTLSLEVVAACSLRCPGCWVAQSREMWTARPEEIMPPILFDAALRFGRELGASKLTLLGGEPTLHPNLPALINRATMIGYKVSVTTNGVCSQQRLSDVLNSGLHGISFSLDGSCSQIHDTLRPSPNGKSTFHLTLESLRRAVQLRSEHGYSVNVNHTIYPRNLHDAEAMIRLSARLGVDSIRLHFTLPGDFPEPDGRISFLEPCKWLALRNRIPDLIRELRVPISAVPGYGELSVAAAKKRTTPYLNIQPQGDIIPCAAYARLPAREQQSVGRLLPTGGVLLNRLSSCELGSNHCCGAMLRLIERLPVAVRNAIEQAGGLGCIILNGPLVHPASITPK